MLLTFRRNVKHRLINNYYYVSLDTTLHRSLLQKRNVFTQILPYSGTQTITMTTTSATKHVANYPVDG